MAISISRVVTDPEAILALDDRLSHRFIELDPFGCNLPGCSFSTDSAFDLVRHIRTHHSKDVGGMHGPLKALVGAKWHPAGALGAPLLAARSV